jgi:hypothetical protein
VDRAGRARGDVSARRHSEAGDVGRADGVAGTDSAPVGFIRFIGVCEILGGIGMVVPGLTGIAPGLTPLGAAGLVIIMIGATVINIVNGPAPFAILTAALGTMCAFVVYGRWMRPLDTTSATKART